MNIKQTIFYGLVLVLALCSMTGCSDEVFGGFDGSQGQPVTIEIGYEQLNPLAINSTRATTEENALNNLQVFVFNEKGQLIGYKYVNGTDKLKQDGTVGRIAIKTQTGQASIYAVANVPTSVYKLASSDDIPTSESSAWDENKAQAGEIDFTLSDLQSCSFLREENELRITESNFLMSGMMNNGNLCVISSNGTVTPLPDDDNSENTATDADIIQLKRIVSKIKFMVTSVDGVTFTPTRYQIKNIPRKGNLISNSEQEITGNTFEDYTSTFVSQNSETLNGYTYNVFSLYLPENLQSTSADITKWTDREADNGNTTDDKAFTNAPKNSTYVIISGIYDGPLTTDGSVSDRSNTVSANVKYFIHLGDFGEGKDPAWSDFNLERNCNYTFKVTVAGVNSIKVEAEKENGTEGSSEGVVLDLSSGKVFTLDSHYGQVNMTFDKSSIVNGRIYIMGEDINGSTGILMVNSSGLCNLDGTAAETPSCLDWICFGDGNNSTYSSLFTSSEKGETTTPSKAKSLIDILKEMVSGSDSFWSNSGTKSYTCFVDENYYKNKPWSDFVNKDPRYIYIARDMERSTDNRSFYADVVYGISQYSIQTSYDLTKSNTINAYGCETLYDDNYGGKSSDGDDCASKVSLYWGGKSDGSDSDTWNGRVNQLGDLNDTSSGGMGSGSRTWAKLSSGDSRTSSRYQWAEYACMSRNRDNNGDGVIDDDEVRWYAPTIEQYFGLFIGENAIDPKAHLFTGNTSDLKNTWVWTARQAPALHYWSNSHISNYTYWAEEGIATSWKTLGQGGGDSAPWGIRCVRNLSKDVTNDCIETPDKYYSYDSDTREILLTNMNTDAVRTTIQDKELVRHDELDVANMPARKFIVAKNLSATTTGEKANTDDNTACSSYSETGDGGASWRAPNLMELGLIMIATSEKAPSSSEKETCRTQFSNTAFRYTWTIDDSGQISMIENSSKGNSCKVRCVRDVE